MSSSTALQNQVPDFNIDTLEVVYLGKDNRFTSNLMGLPEIRRIQVANTSGWKTGELLRTCSRADLALIDAAGLNGELDRLLKVLLTVLPVVVVDSSPNGEKAEQLLKRGVQDYLEKDDVTNPWFQQSISKAVARQTYIRKIEEVRKLERYLAYHDSLTRLPNRQLFSDRLNQAVAKARRNKRTLALLFMDLDGFKQINDRYGHATGDQLLVTMAGRLKACIRESETAARLGGDEFAVILGEVDRAEDAALVAGRILQVLGLPISLAGCSPQVGVSIGIALFPDDARTPATLMQKADTAMYRAKRSGGCTFSYCRQRSNGSSSGPVDITETSRDTGAGRTV